MILDEARALFDKILSENGIQFSDYWEERRNGRVKDVCLTIRIRVEQAARPDMVTEMAAKRKNVLTKY